MQVPLCRNAYHDVTDFEICGFHTHTKKKSRYLENEKSFFLQIKKIINCTPNAHQGLPYGKNVFVVEVIFNNK